MKKIINYFSKTELILWGSSVFMILISFLIFDRENILTLIASLIGVTSLILGAKGHPLSQVLIIIFSILYGIISYSFAYYGEMLTYLGMTAPMAVFALISWLTHPFEGKKTEVTVNLLKKSETIFMLSLTAIVTAIFYFILQFFNTANLIPSTISVTTSFMAVYLTARRSPYFALAYAANDIVLIILWSWASFADTTYVPVVICFAMFLINDLYGFFNWLRMEKRQNAQTSQASSKQQIIQNSL